MSNAKIYSLDILHGNIHEIPMIIMYDLFVLGMHYVSEYTIGKTYVI